MNHNILKPNVFKCWPITSDQLPKSLDDAMPVPSKVRVRVKRPYFYGGHGWLKLGFEDCAALSNDSQLLNPVEAVKKLAELRTLICGEVEFK